MDSLLEGRVARCPSCKKERPSSTTLPFFEFRGEGSAAATHCAECRYTERAHPAVIGRGFCTGFKTDPAGLPKDSFYCGCKGWD